MTFNRTIFRTISMIAIPAIAFSSCSDNDDPAPDPDNGGETVKGKYVLATQVPISGETTNVLITAESLDEGSITPSKDNGLINEGATQWVFNGTKSAFALTYNQGNAATTRSYYLTSEGKLKAHGIEYPISRFSSYGTYNNYIITMSTGSGPASLADPETGYIPQTLLITWIDTDKEVMTTNDTSTGRYSAEDFLGNGEYVTLAGAEQSGSRIYCGVVPMGLSQYGSLDPSHIREGFEDLIATADGGSGGGAYKKGELSNTQWPDECYVAIFSDQTMTDPVLAHTDKISYPAGRFRSQYYQTVWSAENGDIYVFSPSFAVTMTADKQKTQLKAGVCRIPAGSTDFDDYYCNIEEQSNGRSFMRVFPAGGNYFLLYMYDAPLSGATNSATDLAIFDATAKKLTYVKGLPESISSLGKTVYTENGYVYVPINVTDGYPAIYRINTATAQAYKGLEICGSDINGFGYMTPVND